MAPEVIEHFTNRDWPGNIRELENCIQGICAITESQTIRLEHVLGIRPEISHPKSEDAFSTPYKVLKEHMIEKFTKSYISRLLKHAKGNISLSAEISGIKRQSLQKIINRYDIDVSKFRE